MTQGLLAQHFVAIGAKRLKAVEVMSGRRAAGKDKPDEWRSNQHELNGVAAFRAILGEPPAEPALRFQARFIYFSDDADAAEDEALVSWYGASRRDPKRKPEPRLYYQQNEAMAFAAEGDILFLAKRPDDTFWVIVAAAESAMERQLLWLLGIQREDLTQSIGLDPAKVRSFDAPQSANFILRALGIEPDKPAINFLEAMLQKFGPEFPDTRSMAEFARQTLPDISPIEAPDAALVEWCNHEHRLYLALEQHHFGSSVAHLGDSVERMMTLAKSISGRRASRAGSSLEHHICALLSAHQIRYSLKVASEGTKVPDFLFPSADNYFDQAFPVDLLTMLGAKRTLRERWSQILSEADRIPRKHLLTMEAGIGARRIREIQRHNLTLVIPKQNHADELISADARMTVSDFIALVRQRQVAADRS